MIATTAIERLLNALPDLTLAVPREELQWRPGPFHRALVTLPATFSPSPATRMAAALQSRASVPDAEQPMAVAPSVPMRREPGRKRGFWSSFLDVFRV